jgi:predicted ATP-grasp superfamily ATP-dependent carboligase
MRRITTNITDEQFAKLKERERETGATQSVQIRRALNRALGLEVDRDELQWQQDAARIAAAKKSSAEQQLFSAQENA